MEFPFHYSDLKKLNKAGRWTVLYKEQTVWFRHPRTKEGYPFIRSSKDDDGIYIDGEKILELPKAKMMVVYAHYVDNELDHFSLIEHDYAKIDDYIKAIDNCPFCK